MEDLNWFFNHICNFALGAFFAALGYFAPIKGVVNVMIMAILIDLVLGIIAARRAGEGIKSHKLWRTVYKLLFAVVLVALLYAIDKEMGMIQLHKIIAWLITGFEIWSILESAGKITEHKIFKLVKKLMEDKIKDATGIEIKEKKSKWKFFK